MGALGGSSGSSRSRLIPPIQWSGVTHNLHHRQHFVQYHQPSRPARPSSAHRRQYEHCISMMLEGGGAMHDNRPKGPRAAHPPTPTPQPKNLFHTPTHATHEESLRFPDVVFLFVLSCSLHNQVHGASAKAQCGNTAFQQRGNTCGCHSPNILATFMWLPLATFMHVAVTAQIF